MTIPVTIRQLSNHYHFPVASEHANQICHQLNQTIDRYLQQKLDSRIHRELQALGYTADCLVAVRRINIRLNIQSSTDLETGKGLEQITNGWLEAIINGFIRIVCEVQSNQTVNQAIFNDWIATFPNRESAEFSYLEALARSEPSPWWVTSLFSNAQPLAEPAEIIQRWLLQNRLSGLVRLQNLTATTGNTWLHLPQGAALQGLCPLLINMQKRQEITSNFTQVAKQFNALNTEEINLLQNLPNLHQVLILAAVLLHNKQQAKVFQPTYADIAAILKQHIPTITLRHPELNNVTIVPGANDTGSGLLAGQAQVAAASTVADVSSEDHHAITANSGADNTQQTLSTTQDARSKETDEAAFTIANDKPSTPTTLTNAVSKAPSAESHTQNAVPTVSTALGQLDNSEHTAGKSTPSLADQAATVQPADQSVATSSTPQVSAQVCQVGCGGLLFLIRHAARALPDPVYTYANAQIMLALALMALQELCALLPESGQRVTWQRERPLIQAFTGIDELPDKIDLTIIEQGYKDAAQTILEQLVVGIPPDTRPGQHGIAYFFAGYKSPDNLSPLHKLLLRPGRLLLDGAYATLQLPMTAIDPELRLSGWDIDPGWMPALNRVIRIVYQE